MDKPTSVATDREVEAAGKYASDQRLQKLLERRWYGDGLDRLSLREGMNNWATLAMLAIAVVMYACGELVFAWQAGDVVLPSLVVGGFHFGGIVSVCNSLIFILLVFLFIGDGRPAFKQGGVAGNRWTWLTVFSAMLALFAIYTAQTTAADNVRTMVGQREAKSAEIAQLEKDIAGAVIPPRAPAELLLERAQDEAVGSKLNTISAGEAKILCADVKGFEESMACRQKILRASVDCTQDVPTLVRDNACDPIKLAQVKLANIDALEKQQAQRGIDLKTKKDELKALPEASNYFVRQIADWTAWSIPDAQSRVYVLIALICLLVPAFIFANVFERREDPEPEAQQGGTAS